MDSKRSREAVWKSPRWARRSSRACACRSNSRRLCRTGRRERQESNRRAKSAPTSLANQGHYALHISGNFRADGAASSAGHTTAIARTSVLLRLSMCPRRTVLLRNSRVATTSGGKILLMIRNPDPPRFFLVVVFRWCSVYSLALLELSKAKGG